MLPAAIVALALVAAGATTATATDDASLAAVPGELIVRFAPGASKPDRTFALASASADADRGVPLPHTKVVEVPTSAPLEQTAAELEADPAVAYAEPNYIRSLRSVTPNDPRFGEQWALKAIRAPEAWSLAKSNPVLKIAIADDGVDTTHPDLDQNVWLNIAETGGNERETNGVDDDANGYADDLHGWDFVDDDNDPRPEGDYHGTHVAGVVGAEGNNGIGVSGVDWQVALMPLRIFDGNFTTSERMIAAFDYAGRNGARIVNASFGGKESSQAEQDAIARWPDTLFVAAAPNSPRNIDVQLDYPCSYALANIICVTATDMSQRRAGFAATGPKTIDLGAPGVGILGPVPGGYETHPGTSTATAFVSGVAGLILTARPAFTGAQMRAALLGGVLRTNKLADEVASGGVLDARWAVEVALGRKPSERKKRLLFPKTIVTKSPGVVVSTRRPLFKFRSSVPDSTFSCKLDQKRWRRCRSPYRTPRLSHGVHQFRVRAIGPNGERDKTPVKRRFLVVA